MSGTREKDELKKAQQAGEQSTSSQKQGPGASAKAQPGPQESAETLKDVVDKAKQFEGAFYSGVEVVYNRIKEVDTKMLVNANTLSSKVVGYIRKAIDSYKKERKAN
jgi:hypothetical protein